jgi:HSP20 family protein
MALMRFDPFRELDRLAEQALAGARTAHSTHGGVAAR